MMEAWGWPQWFIAVNYALVVILHSWAHGRERKGKFSGPYTIINVAIGAWILYMGGFWT